jgi:cytochrome oxidase Cu insertion factor (SCO1/SenC/PrrC family)
MRKFTTLTMALLLGFAIAQPASAALQLGDPAPDFTLNDAYGNPVSLSDYEGYVVIINFWSSG